MSALVKYYFFPVAAVILLLVGCHGETKSKEMVQQQSHGQLTDAQGWSLGASALLNERNHVSHDTLSMLPMSERNIRDTKRLIRQGWGIESRDDLFEQLLKLHIQGHRAGFEYLGAYVTGLTEEGYNALLKEVEGYDDALNEVRIVKRYYNELGSKSILGWDYSRYICLCRWGYHVGYLGEDEAWEMIMEAARILQERFDSWEDLGRNYIIGRQYWSYKDTQEDGELYEDAFMRLMDMKSSPWNRYAWDTDLGSGQMADKNRVDVALTGQDENKRLEK